MDAESALVWLHGPIPSPPFLSRWGTAPDHCRSKVRSRISWVLIRFRWTSRRLQGAVSVAGEERWWALAVQRTRNRGDLGSAQSNRVHPSTAMSATLAATSRLLRAAAPRRILLAGVRPLRAIHTSRPVRGACFRARQHTMLTCNTRLRIALPRTDLAQPLCNSVRGGSREAAHIWVVPHTVPTQVHPAVLGPQG